MISAARRRVCSMVPKSLALRTTISNSKTIAQVNLDHDDPFYKRWQILRLMTPFPARTATGDEVVEYTVFESSSLQASRKMELSHNDERKPIFFVNRSVPHFDDVITPISLEDDGSLSPKYSIRLPSYLDAYMNCYYSCNGVFCYGDGEELLVWNPATLEARKLPNSPHKNLKSCSCRRCNLRSASWVDPKSEQDYKVLRIFTYLPEGGDVCVDRHPYEIELYSLKTDSWKKMIFSGEMCGRGSSVCYIDGVIYMAACLVEEGNVILSFDFRSETFSTSPLPPFGSVESYHFLKYNGQLSVLSCSHNHNDKGFVVHWVMKNGEWVGLGEYHVCGVGRPLGFARNDELLLFESNQDDHLPRALLMAFDTTTRELKCVPGCNSEGELSLIPFGESFVKLKSSGEEEKEDGRTVESTRRLITALQCY